MTTTTITMTSTSTILTSSRKLMMRIPIGTKKRLLAQPEPREQKAAKFWISTHQTGSRLLIQIVWTAINPATRTVSDTSVVHRKHVQRFWSGVEHILREYCSLARDQDRCRQICQVSDQAYTNPFSATRRWALSRMTDEHQRQLVMGREPHDR